MKNILFTFTIVAVMIFAGIYSFYNLREEPVSNKMEVSFRDDLSDKYPTSPDSVYGKSVEHVPAPDNAREDGAYLRLQQQLQSNADDSEIRLWIKVAFSGVFCLAALYVILSKRYEGNNNEVRKWAYGVLTLIAGVWIGTAT